MTERDYLRDENSLLHEKLAIKDSTLAITQGKVQILQQKGIAQDSVASQLNGIIEVDGREISELKKKNRMWKKITIGSGVVLLLSLIFGG